MHTIVALTDLGPRADGTLRLAARLARRLGARLHVLHALDLIGRPLREVAGPLHAGFIPRARQALAAQLGRSLGPHGEPATGTLHPRGPVDAAVDAARETRACLVVTGPGCVAGEIDLARAIASRAPVAVLAADPARWAPGAAHWPEGRLRAEVARGWAEALGVATDGCDAASRGHPLMVVPVAAGDGAGARVAAWYAAGQPVLWLPGGEAPAPAALHRVPEPPRVDRTPPLAGTRGRTPAGPGAVPVTFLPQQEAVP